MEFSKAKVPEQQPEPRKRLVTKGEYALHLGKQAYFTSTSALCFSIGLLSAGAAFGSGLAWLYIVLSGNGSRNHVLGVFLLSLLTAFSMLHLGITAKDKVETAEPVAPLTRRNTDTLPPEESLVRAASEPAIPQKAVLLRPASGTVETDPQQLLRASVSQDSPSD